MTKDDKKVAKVQKVHGGPPPAMGFYFLGFLGAAFHLVGSVDGFWNIIVAFAKAAVWPAFLINRVFELLRI